MSDVYYDNCVINWKPPADDGGTELTHYIVECLDVTEGDSEWTTCGETMTAQELSMKCTGLKNKHKYKFRVKAVNRLGKSLPGQLLGDVLIKDPWGMNIQSNRDLTKIFKYLHINLQTSPDRQASRSVWIGDHTAST